MGKSGKLFKTLLVGVKAFKSPSKERPTKDGTAANPSRKEEKAQSRKGSKEKCMWSLGKSSSRNRDCAVRSPAASVNMAETNMAQVEVQQCKIVQPAIPLVVTAPAHVSNTPPSPADALIIVGNCCSKVGPRKGLMEGWDESTREERAAAKIQATFRCYSAQRAFRALKALVKLQALARGRIVRRQAAATLRCIQALVRVQAHVRARRVRTSELGQLVQRHLQQAKQQRRKSTEGWISSTSTVHELQAKAQSKQEAVIKRQRALVYAFSEQLRRGAPKKSSLEINCRLDKGHWGWMWLERWTAARSWEHSSSAPKEQPAKYDEKVKAKINAESYKGSLKKERFSGSEFSTEHTKLQSKAEKQMGVIKSESVSCSDFSGEATKVKTHIEGDKEEGALKNEIVSGSDTAVDVTESVSLSPPPLPPPPPPPLPSFRVVTPYASQPCSLSPPPPPPLPSCKKVIPCATQPIMQCKVPSAASIVTPAPRPVASPAISPTSTQAAQLPTVAMLPDVSVTPNTLQTQTDSSARLSSLNQDSSLSISPVESCSPLQPVSPSTMSSAEQRSPQWQHITPPPLQIPDPTFEEISNDVLTPEENVHSRNEGSDAPMNGAVELAYEEIDSIDGEPQTVKNGNDIVRAEILPERIGKHSSSVVPASLNVTEALTKRNNVTGTKYELGECVSPSLPNYMATTLSSKAKARSHNSPKQPDSVSPSSKKRHSLSGSEGKSSPVIHRHISHVRAGSKGHSASLRDGSGDNSPHANGNSQRHVK